MSTRNLGSLLKKLHQLETDLEAEIDKLMEEKQARFRYTLEQGKVHFQKEIKALNKKYKISIWNYLRQARIGHILSAPIIYSVFFPMLLLDIFVTLYQWICFPIYGIPLVNRKAYFIIDRHKLSYLNLIQKFNCTYCSYGNGLIEYTREVTARTEQYWCPIRHSRRSPDPHYLQENFLDYGDAEIYNRRLKTLQEALKDLQSQKDPHARQ